MNSEWQEFLHQQSAEIHHGVVHHFGQPTAELDSAHDGTVLSDLSQFCLLKISGDDAPDFLQNLLSSDVRQVATQQFAQVSSLNSPKGRMLASFLMWCSGADFFLQLPCSLCGAIQKRLSMYILRAKVTITDVSEQHIVMGVSGQNAQPLLHQNFAALPLDNFAVKQHDHGCVIKLDPHRFLITTQLQFAPDLWQKLRAGATPAGSNCWDWLNIRAGIPIILPVTQEQFVPQMANLDLIGGVSFKKGCYPGQEIVARMQYLGKLKRRMYLAHADNNMAPQPGDELFSADMEQQASGMIVNASPAPGGGYDLLAVIQISSRESQSIHLKSVQGAKLDFLSMPYALPGTS